MSKPVWRSIKVQGGQLVEQVRKLIHEGNVRRVVVKQGPKVVAEFPLTVGVVGAVAAPVLAAIGALVALLSDCTLVVERARGTPPRRPAAKTKRKPKQPTTA